MIQLCWALLFLGIAAGCNWLFGIYDKLGVKKISWSWKEFGKGLLKIAIICGSVIGLGFAWEYSGIDFSGAGLEPLTLMTTATGYYGVKAILHLKDIIMGKVEQKKDDADEQ